MRFSLTTLLWLFALVASALVAFDGFGLIVATVAAYFWFLFSHYPRGTAVGCCWGAAISIVLLLTIVPAIQSPRGPHHRSQCLNNMRQVGLALINHDDLQGSLPPCMTMNASGEALHSWRSLVLPYLDRSDLSDAVRWDEAWDSPANQAALSPAVDIYTCPSRFQTASGHDTSYFVVTGPGTLWPPDGPRSLADIPDGAENTVLLIEGDTGVPWAKPEDLALTEAVELLTSPHNPPAVVGHASDPGYFYRPAEVRHVLMADGRVLGIQCPISGELATALLSANGGEEVDLDEVHGHIAPRLDWRRCGGLAFFVLAAIAPALPPIGRWLKEELAHALHGGTS